MRKHKTTSEYAKDRIKESLNDHIASTNGSEVNSEGANKAMFRKLSTNACEHSPHPELKRTP